MKRKLILFFIIGVGFLVLKPSAVNAQDVHFSQYYANPLYLNPAFAGSAICPRIVANFRDQWPAVSGTYMSYSASYDQHFNVLSGGVGVLFLGDRAAAGTVNTNAISLIYSFHTNLSKKVAMRLAVQATFQQKSLDWTKLTFGDMIDPKYGFVYATDEEVKYKSRSVADFSAGIIFYSEMLYGGVSVNHFTQPRESFLVEDTEYSRLPIKFTGHIGALFKIRQKGKKKVFGDMSISPNFIFMYQSKIAKGAAYTSMNVGAYFNCYPITVGLWFRSGLKNVDALIFLFGLEFEPVKIGYSYDMTISTFSGTGGAHEISAQFQLPCPVKTRRIRALNCPSF